MGAGRRRRRASFLEALRDGKSIAAAARAAGVGRRTCYDWRDRDAAFAGPLERSFRRRHRQARGPGAQGCRAGLRASAAGPAQGAPARALSAHADRTFRFVGGDAQSCRPHSRSKARSPPWIADVRAQFLASLDTSEQALLAYRLAGVGAPFAAAAGGQLAVLAVPGRPRRRQDPRRCRMGAQAGARTRAPCASPWWRPPLPTPATSWCSARAASSPSRRRGTGRCTSPPSGASCGRTARRRCCTRPRSPIACAVPSMRRPGATSSAAGPSRRNVGTCCSSACASAPIRAPSSPPRPARSLCSRRCSPCRSAPRPAPPPSTTPQPRSTLHRADCGPLSRHAARPAGAGGGAAGGRGGRAVDAGDARARALKRAAHRLQTYRHRSRPQRRRRIGPGHRRCRSRQPTACSMFWRTRPAS